MTETDIQFPLPFPTHPCPGNGLHLPLGRGVEVVASVEYDFDARPEDNGCYTPEMIDGWKKDRWYFVAVVLHVLPSSDCNIYIDGLYGIGIGLSDGPEDGEYLTEVANNLLRQSRSDIGAVLRDRASRMRKAADQWDKLWGGQ